MKNAASFEQLPEIIYINEVHYTLFTLPLTTWLSAQDPPFVFDKRTPNCQRGYIGRWMLHEDGLWLVGFYAWRDGKHTGVEDLFDGKGEVFADWFSGGLTFEPSTSSIRDGAYPKTTTLELNAGRVVRE